MFVTFLERQKVTEINEKLIQSDSVIEKKNSGVTWLFSFANVHVFIANSETTQSYKSRRD